MTLEQSLRSRWIENWNSQPEMARLHATFDAALNIARLPKQKRDELTRPGHLSEKGVARSLRTTIAESIIGTLQRAEEDVARDEAALETDRAALGKPAVDKTDLFAEMQRQELRTYLRSLPEGDRLGVLMTNPDPALLAAGLAAPPALSGLSPERMAHVRELHVETNFAAEVKALEDRDEAITLARVAVKVARDAIKDEVGLPPAAFDAWWQSGGREPDEERADP